MATEKPSIVIVQGSFQTPLVYAKLATGLRNLGYSVIHPSLPSCTDVEADDFSSRTMEDDARTITEILEQLIEKEEKSVVVVMHSYGGIVGSTAIPQSLAYTSRHAEGKKGGVLCLFYYAAFLLSEGASVIGTFGESPNNYVTSDGCFRIKDGAKTLYSDLPDAEAALWESRLIPQSYLVQTTPTTRAAYEYIPSTYLICVGDQAAPAAFQERFAQLARAEIDRCTAGHSPMLSQPDMLVEKIAAVVDKAAVASV
ncbi:alpha/beta-hydrolase [Aspergillus sclerotioniger CBS 115572]|uniref:Alpha/beta-hydrolase n=1 Tax=Aspergillus sclerotioniger CBS 115572 TaxID=1450535 RepID=A0A317WQG6_9EURO|nr:alpha/beta-hydrolase [Aspergillus sclerotioniger CBS 115572]PWY88673.1 alpha/beta-hydrolase [Aspergillus sclerotioniger CBS 115572]